MDDASISNLFDVQGRIALVTGGSSGLGFMIAEACHSELDVMRNAECSHIGLSVEWLQGLYHCLEDR
jgi:hypothetical protein